MRKSLVLKTLFRTPIKTILTFLLIAAASFALFSRVTDYAVTSREAASAESFYHGVAALDLSVPSIEVGYTYFALKNKPWPKEEKMEEFSSLPGVTLAETRYMTAGLMDYKRLTDDSLFSQFALEGSYIGHDNNNSDGITYLLFDDVTLLAGDVPIDDEGLRNRNPERLLQIATNAWSDEEYEKIRAEGYTFGDLPLS